ncbi:S-formylglutathione hydrolase isoform X3 [Phyllopteryx taeniolatus]|uniref:S-formylglutathione hydrolase isoform X3 n=1 Tax=Phyllopteryx taeniolatus TaxID=161469 RepID=UPI002AD392D3|nr:S-formylglutathione hydrolase isoform X3 [Phyllopteryx taeniolatus]
MLRLCVLALARRDGPHGHDLDAGLGARVEAAVVDGVPDGDVAVQRDGTQMHDGCRREEHVQMALTQVSSNKCAGGFQKVFEHDSVELKCKMKFAVFLPPKAETHKCPVLYWLSGLTCTEQNFITKAGSQLAAAENGIIIVAPDTSPRGCGVEGEDDSWDLGTGAGFYVDATHEPWKNNYRMYSYVTQELPKLINSNFPADPDRMSISGHSMGGHGALICALKNPGKYKAVSAFAPICNPMQCPWGQKAFNAYLGPDRTTWEAYDATTLASGYSGPQLDILIDQGRDDQFLSASQLLPDNLIAVCSEKKIPVVFRLQPGYDHSYYFIYSFFNDHIKHHAKFLNA